jgi:hypothetical protein
MLRTALAIAVAEDALRRLAGDRPEYDDVWAAADGLAFVLNFGRMPFEGELACSWSDRYEAARHAAARAHGDRPAGVACLLALYDALDALLDFTSPVGGHDCQGGCCPCEHSDAVTYHVRSGIDLLATNDVPPSAAVTERAILSAERSRDRARAYERSEWDFPPHSAREHADPAEQVENLRRLLPHVRALEASRATPAVVS